MPDKLLTSTGPHRLWRSIHVKCIAVGKKVQERLQKLSLFATERRLAPSLLSFIFLLYTNFFFKHFGFGAPPKERKKKEGKAARDISFTYTHTKEAFLGA